MELTRRNLLRTSLFGATALNIMPGGLALAQVAECLPQSCTITAGQTIPVGTMTVSNNSTDLRIEITLTDGWTSQNVNQSLKVWVGTDFTNMPQTKNGNPIPGQFPYKQDATGTTATLIIPLKDAGIILPAQCGSVLHIVAHLDVTGPGGAQTAFGGCTAGATGARWWFYMDYVICCGVTPPPVLGNCQTAFAKGNWIWSTDPKSNPAPKLPTLSLIKNRWGWAINLTAPGTTSYDIYAGAALNNTSKGKKVGTLTVSWYDSDDPEDNIPDTVVITYQLSSGYRLSETHVYASASPPTTTAPGQYGNLSYHQACENVQSYQYTLPLIDNVGTDTCKNSVSCSGVWIIAHAVVCDAEDTCN